MSSAVPVTLSYPWKRIGTARVDEGTRVSRMLALAFALKRFVARRFLTVDAAFLSVLVAVVAFSVGFFVVSYSIFLHDPDYFNRRLIAGMSAEIDPIVTGAVEKSDATPPIPVPLVVRARELQAGDYQIVMVFDHEAFLATDTELMRVRTGSTLPGLGTILSITSAPDGDRVEATNATLKTTAKPGTSAP